MSGQVHKMLISDKGQGNVQVRYLEYEYNGTPLNPVLYSVAQHPNLQNNGPGRRVYDQPRGLLFGITDREFWKLEPSVHPRIKLIPTPIELAYTTYFSPIKDGVSQGYNTKDYLGINFRGGIHLFKQKSDPMRIERTTWLGEARKGYFIQYDEDHGRIWVKQNRGLVVLQLMCDTHPIDFSGQCVQYVDSTPSDDADSPSQ